MKTKAFFSLVYFKIQILLTIYSKACYNRLGIIENTEVIFRLPLRVVVPYEELLIGN
jgi:hypothetical protein